MVGAMILYHWATAQRVATAVRHDTLKARRWRHFLEAELRFARGTSWAEDPLRWRADHVVRLALESDRIANSLHRINGNRTYLLTRGLTDRDFDPNAYRHEPTDPDEVFVEGDIRDLRSALVEIAIYSGIGEEVRSQIAEFCGSDTRIAIVQIDPVPSARQPAPAV